MAIVITRQPKNLIGIPGDDVFFVVEATGEGLAYQWEYLTLGATKWMDNTMAGNTTATLTVTVRTYHNGYKYRCLITDANGDTLRTDEVTLTVTTDSSVGFVNYSTMAEIADAIRAKTETTESMLPSEMAGLIAGISTGIDVPAIAAIDAGSFTLTESSGKTSIEHNLGIQPDFAVIIANEALDDSNTGSIVAELVVYAPLLGSTRVSASESSGNGLYKTFAIVEGINSSGMLYPVHDKRDIETYFLTSDHFVAGATTTYNLTAGVEYRWMCGKFAE